MAGHLNKVMLIGNVGREPEFRSTQDGKEIANLSLATTESWKDKLTGEAKEKTEWHRIVVFTPGLINVIRNYVTKGSKLYIEGALQTRKWTDPTGQEKYSTEITLQNFSSTIILLNSKGSSNVDIESGEYNRNPSYQPGTGSSNIVPENFDDEVPF